MLCEFTTTYKIIIGYSFSFNLWDGCIFTHWAESNDFMHVHDDKTFFGWISMPSIVVIYELDELQLRAH
jgi:hypothetical protein